MTDHETIEKGNLTPDEYEWLYDVILQGIRRCGTIGVDVVYAKVKDDLETGIAVIE